MVRSLCVFIVILMIGCGHRAEADREVIRHSVNGEMNYIISKEGSVVLAYKKEYAPRGYQVAINNDTIRHGQEFLGLFVLPYGKTCQIEITEPEKISLPPNTTQLQYYEFTPWEKGVFNYSGTFSCDTMQLAFHYRIVVF
jgi:hypothetical protein